MREGLPGSKAAALRTCAAMRSLTNAIDPTELTQNVVQGASDDFEALQVDRLTTHIDEEPAHVVSHDHGRLIQRSGVDYLVEPEHILAMLVDIRTVNLVPGRLALSQIEPGAGFQRNQVLRPQREDLQHARVVWSLVALASVFRRHRAGMFDGLLHNRVGDDAEDPAVQALLFQVRKPIRLGLYDQFSTVKFGTLSNSLTLSVTTIRS